MSNWFFDSPISGTLRRNHYNLINIDCPWKFEMRNEETSGEVVPYETQHLEWIKSLPVKDLADKDCLVLHWVTAPLLDVGIDVLKAWGAKYVPFIHWRKVYESGMPAMGRGFRVRTMGELCLLGTYGAPKHKPFNGAFPGIRRESGRKPESFYHNVDRFCPDLTRRADVFARQSRVGWDTWGNERTLFDRRAA